MLFMHSSFNIVLTHKSPLILGSQTVKEKNCSFA